MKNKTGVQILFGFFLLFCALVILSSPVIIDMAFPNIKDWTEKLLYAVITILYVWFLKIYIDKTHIS